MAHKSLDTYLRTYRRRAGLSQKEVAFLLGCRSGSRISRYEHMRSMPTLKTAFGFGAIFNAPVQELFTGVYQKVEKRIARRAKCLIRRMETGHVGLCGAEKLSLLQQAIKH